METFFRDLRSVKEQLPSGKSFALVSGCFDLFHVGHIHVLKFAKSLEDLVVVAVLSDEYVHAYKGPARPIINEKQRATIVASSKFVDYAYIADVSPNSPEVLAWLKPDSIVFGEEAGKEEKMVRRISTIKAVSPTTRIATLPRYEEEPISTGIIIHRIQLVRGDPCKNLG